MFLWQQVRGPEKAMASLNANMVSSCWRLHQVWCLLKYTTRNRCCGKPFLIGIYRYRYIFLIDLHMFRRDLRKASISFKAQTLLSADCSSFQSNYLDCFLGRPGYEFMFFRVYTCVSVCLHICTAVFPQQ